MNTNSLPFRIVLNIIISIIIVVVLSLLDVFVLNREINWFFNGAIAIVFFFVNMYGDIRKGKR